jgi:hypothetical protein
VAADDTHLYWMTENAGGASSSGTIVEANLDGTNPTTIATGQDYPDGLAVQATVPPKATPSIVATPSASQVLVRQSISDSATVTGGDSPSGTVTFELFANDACSGTPAFTSASQPLSGGTAHSAPFTPTSSGTFHWVAVYSGDTNNNPVSTPCAGGAVTVMPVIAVRTARAKITAASISSKRRRARFSFQATGATRFQCALVKRPTGRHKKTKPRYRACRSPKTYKRLARGRYTFYVRALNAAGAGSPATRKFKIA